MRFQYLEAEWLPTHIKLFLDEGCWYEVRKAEDERSLRQNALIHWHIYRHCVEAWLKKDGTVVSNEHVHHLFKSLFLAKLKHSPIQWDYYEEGSTKKLSKKAFSEYVENIKQWVFDNLDYDIPPPEDREELLYWQWQMT
jgi:hypothetical protein